MKQQSQKLSVEELRSFNISLKAMFLEVATGSTVRRELERFRRLHRPFRVRVEWLFDDEPLDATIR